MKTHKLSTGNKFKQFIRNNGIFTPYFVQATRYEHCASAAIVTTGVVIFSDFAEIWKIQQLADFELFMR